MMTGDRGGRSGPGAPAGAGGPGELGVAETVTDGEAPSEAGPHPVSASAGGSPRAVNPGDNLGRYVVGDELGAGGMASVFRARDTELRRDVAVKVLFPHLARKEELTRRFQREARAAAGLEHPNILRVYDVGGGQDRRPPYIVMELVRGQSLREVAEAGGPLLAELVACIGALACDALAVAHAAGIVHRDVKPANLMLADDGRLLLADFGVARLDDDDSLVTRTGALLGTPSFMAPEQALGNPVDARSDLYSVGAMLYQLATASLPYAGPTAKIVTDAAKGTATPAVRRRPAVGSELSRLIQRLMAPEPAGRPASATLAAAALRAVVAGGGLGEPADEVRAFAADRTGWEAARRPAVVARLVARAREGRARRTLPQALALLDRALALAPADPEAVALAAAIGRPGRPRWLLAAIAGGAVAVAGAGVVLIGLDPAATARPVDASLAATPVDAGPDAPDAPGPAVVTAAPVDAAPPDALPGDGGRGALTGVRPRATDARPAGSTVTPVDPAPPIDAAAPDASDGAAAPDPRIALPAPVEPARVTFVFDTWCNLSIDGGAAVRANRTLERAVAPGRHTVECTQGPGLATWSGTLDVAAGAVRRVEGTLLAAVDVVIAAGDRVQIGSSTYPRGATVKLRPGRYRVTVRTGDKVTSEKHVDVPHVPRCTLREQPALDCYRS